MSLELAGRVCVLTGASGGIGSALAYKLARSGVSLILAGRNKGALTALQRMLPDGSVIKLCAGDLSTAEARQTLADLAIENDTSLLVNLFGQNDLKLFRTQASSTVENLLSTNLLAPIELTRLLLPSLTKRDEARIVNVGSVFGAIGHPGYAVYCASKAGVRAFSEALGRELADTSVRVIHVAPRATRTPMNDAVANRLNEALGNTLDEPAAVAGAVIKALVRGKPRVTLGLPERFFTVLNALLPGVVDKAMKSKLSTISRIIDPETTESMKEIRYVET